MPRMRAIGRFALVLLPLSGCETTPESEEVRSTWSGALSSGSQPLAASADGLVRVGLLADEGLVVRAEADKVSILALGGTPSRVASLGDKLLVTLRSERAIAVLAEVDGALVEVDRVATGAEPMGVVVSPDGSRVYVALYGHDEVRVYDGELALLTTLEVSGLPSWLALHPSGQSLYVVAGVGGVVTWFDLREDEAVGTPIEIPAVGGAGRDGDLFFTRRLTGDPAVRPDGAQLAVPGLWVDNTSAPKHSAEEQATRDPAVAYEMIGLGLAPTNPGLVLVELNPDSGEPLGVELRYATSEASPTDPERPQVVRGYLAGVAYSPDGAYVAAPMENSRLVVLMAPDQSTASDTLGGFREGPLATVLTDEGPRGVSWSEADLTVLNVFSLTMAQLPAGEAIAGIDAELDAGGLAHTHLSAEPGTALSPPVFDEQLTQGRLLFSSAIFTEMATRDSGVSCTTCHVDSRMDGIAWPDFDKVPRQTKSLAGPMSLTAPFTWTEDVLTVAEESRITSESRLGGRNATDAQHDAVAAWIEHTPDVDHAGRGTTTEAVTRGKALFEREDVGCVSCHGGVRYSDQARHDLYELAGVDTPALVGIAATAPYLHDGRAPTLRAVLESSRDGAMGDTSMLSEAELDDLEAFLRSL